MMELGQYSEAREAFGQSLQLDPGNNIAKKNLQRLEALSEEGTVRQTAKREISPHEFIEDTGKAGVTKLFKLGDPETVVRLGSGESVTLRMEDGKLLIDTSHGEYIGQVEPRLASRLLELAEGGNRYEGAITGAGEDGVRVILREVFQAPEQIDKVSFPSKTADGIRPDVKESIKRYELGEQPQWSGDDDEAPDETVPEGITIVDGRRGGLGSEEGDES